MPMVTVQRNLPFSSISPSHRFPPAANCERDSNDEMNQNRNNSSPNNNNNTNSNGNSHPTNVGLGIPSLQRRQSSNTAQILDAYALESSLPMLTAFPFHHNSFSNVNANTYGTAMPLSSSTPSNGSPNVPLRSSSNSSSFASSMTAAQDVNDQNPTRQQQSYFPSDQPISRTSNFNFDYADMRRKNSLDYGPSSSTLPPTNPLLQSATSSFSYNQSLPSLGLSGNFDSTFSPPKLPPLRHISTGEFFPHSSSFDMATSSSFNNLTTPIYPPVEVFSTNPSGTIGSEMPNYSYPSATGSNSLIVPNSFYNGEMASHDDCDVPPLSPLSTVYSSPPRSARSTPASATNATTLRQFSMQTIPIIHSEMSPHSISQLPQLKAKNLHKRKREQEVPHDLLSSQSLATNITQTSPNVHNSPRPSLPVGSTKYHRIPKTSPDVKSEHKKRKLHGSNKLSAIDVPVKPEREKVPSTRHVFPAVKLRGPEEGDGNVVTPVEQIYYPRPDQPKPHRIRLIRVTNPADNSVSVYAHGADVGSVVERKSNISRLYGRFESPTEKLLMNVPGPHNHTVGQESNILTEKGMYRFLQTNKMKGQDNYKQWILNELIPRLRDHPPITSTTDSSRKNFRYSSKRASPPQPHTANFTRNPSSTPSESNSKSPIS